MPGPGLPHQHMSLRQSHLAPPLGFHQPPLHQHRGTLVLLQHMLEDLYEPIGSRAPSQLAQGSPAYGSLWQGSPGWPPKVLACRAARQDQHLCSMSHSGARLGDSQGQYGWSAVLCPLGGHIGPCTQEVRWRVQRRQSHTSSRAWMANAVSQICEPLVP